jgi:hypothetical protein
MKAIAFLGTALVADLMKDSTTLTNVSKQFVDRGRDLMIYTFSETQKLHGVVVCYASEAGARRGCGYYLKTGR